MSIQYLIDEPEFTKHVTVNKERYNKDEIILEENSIGNDLFYVLGGNLSVRSCISSDIQHDLATGLAKLETGDIFGEISIFDSEPRSAQVIAMNDCMIARINGAELIHYMDEFPDKGYFILRDLIFNLIANIRQSNLRTKTILELYIKEKSNA